MKLRWWVLTLFTLVGLQSFAQLPVNVRAIYLDESFDQPIDLVYELATADEDQWVSKSLDGHTNWVQRNDRDICASGGYMAVPMGEGTCPAAELYSPILQTGDCSSHLQISYKRRFQRSGAKADLELFTLDAQGQRRALTIQNLTLKDSEDCEIVTVDVDGVNPNSRLVLRSPTLCTALLIDDLRVRSVPIDAAILTPSTGQIQIGRNTSQLFTAQAESTLSQISFKWSVRKANADGEPRIFQGQEVSVPFPDKGLYEVTLIATDGCAFDITPPRVEVWVTDTITQITSPETNRRLPLVLQDVPTTQAFVGVVEDPNSLIHAIRWLNGRTELCREVVTPGFAARTTSCTAEFTSPQLTAITLQSLGAEDRVIDEDTQIVWVAPKLKAVVVTPRRDQEFDISDTINLLGTAIGSHGDDAENQYGWLVDGALYAGKAVNFKPSRHGAYTAKFVVRNPALKLGDEAAVSFFVNDPDHRPFPEIIAPRGDYVVPPGNVMYFEASYGDVPPDQRSLYWEIVEEATGEVLTSGEGPVLGKVTFPHVGLFVARLYLRGGENERLVATRTVTVAEAVAGSRNPAEPLPLSDGIFEDLTLDQEHYFQTKVGTYGHTLQMTMDFGDGAQLVFYPPNGERIVRCIQGRHTMQLSGLPAGDYTWGVIPGGDCVLPSKTGQKAGFSFSVYVLAPALYFSDVVETREYTTQLGIVNPNNELAEITIIGYDQTGTILCQVSREIQPMGSFRDSAANVFGDKAQDVVWARVDSTATLIGYTRTVSVDQMEAYAVSGARLLQSELYVPHIAIETETWYTLARVVNGQEERSEAKMITRNQNQPLTNSESFSKDNVDFEERLGVIDDNNNWAEFRDQNAEATLAGSEIFGTQDGTRQVVGLGLAGSIADNPNFTTSSEKIYITHIAGSNDFWTGLALVNRGSVDQVVQINAYGNGGVRTGDGSLTLQANEKLVKTAANVMAMANIQTSDVDWLEITAGVNVTGYELFGTQNGGYRLAGIEGISDVTKNLCVPFVDHTGSLWHGVALVNVTDAPSNLSLTLRSEGGVILAQSALVLQPKEKKIFTLEEVFGTTPADAAWLECVGTQQLVGFEIFGDWTNEHMSGIIAQ